MRVVLWYSTVVFHVAKLKVCKGDWMLLELLDSLEGDVIEFLYAPFFFIKSKPSIVAWIKWTVNIGWATSFHNYKPSWFMQIRKNSAPAEGGWYLSKTDELRACFVI